MRPTPAIEDYLATILALQQAGEPVIGARLAERLGVSPPTVTEMLRRLLKEGYVSIDRHKEVTLTSSGLAIAESVVRRHRIAERWLTDQLGFDRARAAQEADKLEHALAPEVAERLHVALGLPQVCPDGNPLTGEPAAEPRTRPLAELEIGEAAVVARVSPDVERDAAFLAELDQGGIVPGARLTVLQKNADELRVRCGTRERTLTRAIAAKVFVRPPEPQAEQSTAPLEDQLPVEVEVSAVEGWCRARHYVGERFEVGHCSPSGLCVEALAAMFPVMQGLRRRALAEGGAQTTEVTAEMPCPEDGSVTFRLRVRPRTDQA